MRYKYGTLSEDQFSGYVQDLHGNIHLLLIYAEQNRSLLSKHFANVQRRLNAANELLEHPKGMTKLIAKIEEARQISEMNEFDFRLFRKQILDAHALTDEIFGR